MFELLLLLFIIFVFMPLVRAIMAARRARRHIRDMFSGMNGGQSRNTYSQPRPEEPAHKKKIDPSVGEYVSFEEITEVEHNTTSADSTTTVKTEQQITDVEWEDLP